MAAINELGTSRKPIVLPTTRLSLEGIRGANIERIRFWNMLVAFVPSSGYVPPQGRKVKILDFACGACDEAPLLNRYFGGSRFGADTSDNVQFIGIDRNQAKIEEAAATFDEGDYTFIHGDATNLSKYPEIPQQVDLVFFRNPNYPAAPLVWTEIFRQGLGRLSDDGLLISTLFSEEEHRLIVDLVQRLGCKIIVNERNPETGRDIMPNQSADRYVLIAKKSTEDPQASGI